MKKETFPNLSFEVNEDGMILLEQWQNHELVRIDVHPQEFAHIGRALFGGKSPADKRSMELERRISVLREKIEVFVRDAYHREEIIERCGLGGMMLCQLDALLDLAYEFDGGIVSIPSAELNVARQSEQAPQADEAPQKPGTALVPVADGQQLGLAV